MFNKVANFRMLPTRPAAPGVNAPANDNRRNGRPCASRRARAPRLICRWSLSATTGRPVCRWELDNADEPNPRLRGAWRDSGRFHKTVFQLSYQGEAVGAALHVAKWPAHNTPSTRHPSTFERVARCCTHVTRRCDLTPFPTTSSHRRIAQ